MEPLSPQPGIATLSRGDSFPRRAKDRAALFSALQISINVPRKFRIFLFKGGRRRATLTLKWRAWWRRRANGPARAVRQWCRLKQAGSFRPLPRISRWLQRLHQGLPACESAHTPLSVAKIWKARATSWDGILPLTMGKRKRPLFVSPRSPLDPVCKQEILETLHIRSATDDARRAGWRATIILGRTRRGKTFADEKCSRVSRRTTRHLMSRTCLSKISSFHCRDLDPFAVVNTRSIHIWYISRPFPTCHHIFEITMEQQRHLPSSPKRRNPQKTRERTEI